MSQRFSSGSEATWHSCKGRQRAVCVVMEMKASVGLYLVQIRAGLPGEAGAYRMVPEGHLVAP